MIIEPLNQESWRFIQLDALGAPLARQVLVNGQWRNDGFLPPNREASRLFSAVYAYLAIKRHWPVPEGIQVKIEKVEQGEEIRWQEQQWRVKELEDE